LKTILENDDEVVALDKPKIDRDYFCIPCQIHTQNMSHNKRSKKHVVNVLALQTKFRVHDEIIKNRDFEPLVSEKGWLLDSVSTINSEKLLFLSF
jgi:hypothetical protein